MTTVELYVLFAFAVCAMAFLWWNHRQGERSLAAVYGWCDTSDAFDAWRKKNPKVHVGLSAAARWLVGERIRAYDAFIMTHPYCDDGPGYRNWLIGLLDDVPRKEAKKRQRK